MVEQFAIGQSVRLRSEKHMHGFRKLDWPPQITVIEAGSTGIITEASMRNDKIQYSVRFDGYNKGNVLYFEDLEAIDDSERLETTAFHKVLAGRVQSDMERGWKVNYQTPKHERHEELNRILMNLEHFTKVIRNDEGEYELVWAVEVFW